MGVSSTEYSISFPALSYWGNMNVHFQWSEAVTVWLAMASPLAFNMMFSTVGRFSGGFVPCRQVFLPLIAKYPSGIGGVVGSGSWGWLVGGEDGERLGDGVSEGVGDGLGLGLMDGLGDGLGLGDGDGGVDGVGTV